MKAETTGSETKPPIHRDPRNAICIVVLIAVSCLAAVIIGYNSLPAVLPVTRWSSTAKSPFVAVRIPLINVLTTIGLAAIWTAFDSAGFPRVAGLTVMATAAVKSIGQALELLTLRGAPSAWGVLTAASIVSGLAVALATSRPWYKARCWRSAEWTSSRKTIAIGALVGIFGLNVAAVTS